MLDKHGYRPNVGIILLNQDNQVFWGKRIREQSWQFPQGGINAAESPQQAMYRELHEEIGLGPQHVTVLGRTRDWLHYDVPVRRYDAVVTAGAQPVSGRELITRLRASGLRVSGAVRRGGEGAPGPSRG